MERNLNDIYFACSYALDCIEKEVVGVTTNHGKRVAYLSLLLAKAFSLTEEEQVEIMGLAVLHDSALTQLIKEEKDKGIVVDKNNINSEQLRIHCVMGEKNIEMLPFKTDVKNVILYHHENADGSGVFMKKADETPIKAQIIHLADTLDAQWSLDDMNQEKYTRILEWMERNADVLFSRECVEHFLNALSYELVMKLENHNLEHLLQQTIPASHTTYTDQDLYDVASLFARIIDYKSNFTSRHSLGIAKKAKKMAEYYGYDADKTAKLYFAGALHDIGKLLVVSEVLEKPDKLTEQEYQHIQNHAYATYQILNKIQGMDDITEWAAFHHEKLDGSGYPFGKKGEEISKECRVMCCLDIYQALTEDRPYKPGFSHEKTIQILDEMAEKNQLDKEVLQDINTVFQNG